MAKKKSESTPKAGLRLKYDVAGESLTFPAMPSIGAPGPAEQIAMVERIRQGLPLDFVEHLAQDADIALHDLVEFGVIPRRTLAHSKQNEQFSPAQSDRAVRFLRVFRKAKDTFGSKDKALTWLKRPTRPLEGHTPLALLDTEAGARLVEDLLMRIDHGVAA